MSVTNLGRYKYGEVLSKMSERTLIVFLFQVFLILLYGFLQTKYRFKQIIPMSSFRSHVAWMLMILQLKYLFK